MKSKKRLKLFYYTVRILTSLLLVASILNLIINADDTDISRGIFVILQSVILLSLSFGPSIIEKRFKIEIPDFMESIFLVFIIAALFLGEIAEFFVNISWWDDVLHTISGFLIAIVGFSVLNTANKDPKKALSLKPIFISIFVFCFSITIGVIWEFFEFTVDSLSSTSNMTRTINSITMVPYVGLEALSDTIHDLFLASISSLIVSIFGYFDAKKNLSIFSKWIIKSTK